MTETDGRRTIIGWLKTLLLLNRQILSSLRRPARRKYVILFLLVLSTRTLLSVYNTVYRFSVGSSLNTSGDIQQFVSADDRNRKVTPSNVSRSGHERNTFVEKTAVLLMTYMRGGSSFLGEMFNQNPRAMYWFEPFDGAFSELYGSRHGWFPIDLLYDDNERLRLFTDYEEEALLKLVTALITCNITALPTDTLAHYATVHIVQKRLGKYAACLADVNSGTNRTLLRYADGRKKIATPWECKGKIMKYCPRHFSTADRLLASSMYCLHVHPISPFRDLNVTLYHGGRPFVPECERRSADYLDYAHCMRTYRRAMRHCVPLLERVCADSNLIGMKAIRLRADLVQNLMVQNPRLKLVYEVRDPRGVVLSRKNTGLLSEMSGKNVTREAALLCQRMAYDLSIVRNMEVQFPGRVLRVKYEQLALHPREQTETFYRFLQLDVPDEVLSYLTSSVTANSHGNAYNTIRTNGTENAFKWQKLLSPAVIQSITRVCLDVIEQYSYPIME